MFPFLRRRASTKQNISGQSNAVSAGDNNFNQTGPCSSQSRTSIHFESYGHHTSEREEFKELNGHLFSNNSLRMPVRTFVPNEALHSEIQRLLQQKDLSRSCEPRILLIWGMGGCGKTQSILHYACRCTSEYKTVFWLNATSKSTLNHDITVLYREMTTSPRDKQVTPEYALSFVKAYLLKMQGPWLMVLDTDNQQKATKDYDIFGYIPQVSTMDVIITSRNRNATSRWTLGNLQVPQLKEKEAADILLRCSDLEDTAYNRSIATCIVNDLERLPLATALVGNYIGSNPLLNDNITSFLSDFVERKTDLMSRLPSPDSDSYTMSVFTTWEPTVDVLYHTVGRLPVYILSLMSCLGSKEVERKFLIETLNASNPSISSLDSEKSFAALAEHGLIWQSQTRKNAIDTHTLVHEWAFYRLNAPERVEVTTMTMKTLSNWIERHKGSAAMESRLLSHILANQDVLARLDWNFVSNPAYTLESSLHVGDFLRRIGWLDNAYVVQTRNLRLCQMHLGAQHPLTISAMASLAGLIEDDHQQRRLFGPFESGGPLQNDSSSLMRHSICLPDHKMAHAAELRYEVALYMIKKNGCMDHGTWEALQKFAYAKSLQGHPNSVLHIAMWVWYTVKTIEVPDSSDIADAEATIATILGHAGDCKRASELWTRVSLLRARLYNDPAHHKSLHATLCRSDALFRIGEHTLATQILRDVLSLSDIDLGLESKSYMSRAQMHLHHAEISTPTLPQSVSLPPCVEEVDVSCMRDVLKVQRHLRVHQDQNRHVVDYERELFPTIQPLVSTGQPSTSAGSHRSIAVTSKLSVKFQKTISSVRTFFKRPKRPNG